MSKKVKTEIRIPVALHSILRAKAARLGISADEYAAYIVMRMMDDHYAMQDAAAQSPPSQ